MSKFDLQESTDGKWYFNLKAENGHIIATSEMYETEQGALNGIDSVRANAPKAVVDEKDGGSLVNFDDVSRLEIITEQGRHSSLYGIYGVQLSFQDDGRTIKLFCKAQGKKII